MSIAVVEPEVTDKTYSSFSDLFDDLWAVIVWNDDVNTIEHVVDCFIEYVGHDPDRAIKLAFEIHINGKGCVAVRPRDEAEDIVHALLQNQIQANLDRA